MMFRNRERRWFVPLVVIPLVVVLGIAATVPCVSVPAWAQSSDQVTLRYKFKVGDEYVTTIRQEMTTQIVGIAVAGATKMTQSTTIRQTVKGVTDGIATIDHQVTRLTMNLEAAGNTLAFDSANVADDLGPVGNLLKPTFMALAKARFTTKNSELGEMVEPIVYAEDLLTDLQRANPAANVPFSEETFKQTVMQMWIKLPEAPVKTEGTWDAEVKTAVAKLGAMTTTSKFTYQGTEELDGVDLIQIGVERSLALNVLPGGKLGSLEVTEQSSTGSDVLFNNKSGFLSEATYKQRFTLLVDEAIEQTINQTVTVTTDKGGSGM